MRQHSAITSMHVEVRLAGGKVPGLKNFILKF